MKAQPCLPQDIHELNHNKEYTLISTLLLEKVLTDPNLNAQSVKLWQLLFNLVRYNDKLEIKISYSYLSKKLNKSTRTIARYIETLQKNGYLTVSHNFDKNGGQRPSTISVRVPDNLIQDASKTKDRQHANNFNRSMTLLYKNESLEKSVEINNINEGTIHNNIKSANVLRETYTSESNNSIYSDSKKSTVAHEPSVYENEILPTSCMSYDKIDMGGADTNGIHKDINKKDINNNNNVVVFHSEDQKAKLDELQKKIEFYEKQLIEGDNALLHIKDHIQIYDQIRKNSEINSALYLTRIAIEKMQKDIQINQLELDNRNKLNNNPGFMLEKEGDRPLSVFTFKRLLKSLGQHGHKGEKLNNLINEIIFEARFGSLITCNKTKKPLSLDNAVNIALKLVRENRWSTPKLLKLQS